MSDAGTRAMILHQLAPLAALFLNVCLALLALQRDARSALNRVFAAFAAALACWMLGAFLLRRAPDAATAWTAQVVIHAGIAFLPALHYHFVAAFLGEPVNVPARRRPLPVLLPYIVGGLVLALALSRSPSFIRGVQLVAWGFAPVPGPLYVVFVLWFNATIVAGLWRLQRASRTFPSSFRRHRARLIVLGTAVCLAGGAADFINFLGRLVSSDFGIYPLGVVTNMVFALFLGTSIIRYRMFDVGAAVRRIAVYLTVGAVLAVISVLAIRAAGRLLVENGHGWFWLVPSAAAVFALALSPLGRRAGELVDQVMFRRRAGCHDTLLELSRAVGMLRTIEDVTATLVHGVATGVPVTHCTLLMPKPGATMLTCVREHVIVGTGTAGAALAIDGPVAGWLKRTGEVLVRESERTDAALAVRLEGGADELARLHATLIVPLRFDDRLTGVLAIGEKLSGELFVRQELDVLDVLASQAALALDNARLLRESDQRLRDAERLHAELDRFVESTWHDLKAPLVALDGLSGLVLADDASSISAESRRYLDRIQVNVRRMSLLVGDLLTTAHAGRDMRACEAVSVDGLVDEVLETMAERLRARHVTVVRSPLGTVRATPADLSSVFANLLSNAIAYLGDTPDPTIEIGMREEADHVEYWVSDNGVGIDPAYHEKVFEMFQRLAEVKTEGTGLGLAIVKKIVDAVGGRVWLDSAHGAGTTVRFTWPRTDPDAASRATAAERRVGQVQTLVLPPV